MSHIRVKTKYNTEGDYGSIEEKTVYAHHNLSADYVTFYDEDGRVILSVPDTLDNNLLDAINRLYLPFKKEYSRELEEGVEYYYKEEFEN